MYLVCWETEIDDSKQITAHDDIIIGHWTLLIYESKRIQGWNLPLRQQSINHTETDSDFIVLFNLITAEAINIKKKNPTWLGKRGLFSVEMICKWISTCLIMLFSSSPPPSRLLFCYVCTSTHWWVMAWQQVKTETQHACTQITFTNMRCHVSKWHWHMCGKQTWSSFQVQRLDESKGSSLKHHCHFPFCVLRLCESGAAVLARHRAICEGDSTRTRPFKIAQTMLSYVSHHSQAENWENCVKDKRASQPLVLDCGRVWGGSVEESWSNTRSDHCIALERQKHTDTPRGFGSIRKSLSCPFPSSRK